MRYTYVRQHDTTDCAAACLAMVCLHYKKEITITRLRDMMGTDLKGTNLTGMEKAAQELGFSTAAVRVDRENFLSEFTTPCIAQVITDEGLAHFVTVFKKTTIKDDGERRRHMLRQEEERKKCADEGKQFKCRAYVIIGVQGRQAETGQHGQAFPRPAAAAEEAFLLRHPQLGHHDRSGYRILDV